MDAIGDGERMLISLSGIGKDYVTEAVTVRALRHVDLRSPTASSWPSSGERVGKSTMMNIIGCLDAGRRAGATGSTGWT